MFPFLKKIFGEKQEQEKSLALGQLDDWLSKKEGQLSATLVGILKEAELDIKDASEKVQQCIDALKEAKLQNPNIPPKAYHFMQGNRESYAKIASLFLRDAVPKDIAMMNYGQAKEYASDFKALLEGFLSSSLRNYQVLQHFFAHESQAIAKGVKEMENAIKGMDNAISSAGLDAVSQAKEGCVAIRQKLLRRQQLEGQIAKERAEAKDILEKKKSSEGRLASILDGEEYKEYLSKKEGIRNAEEDVMLQERQFSIRFSSLEKALKKYSKLSFEHEKIISSYAEFPQKAIREDHSLAILHILPKLEGELKKGSLGLDEKRTQKSLDAIRSISLEFLNTHLGAIQKLEEKKKALQDSIAGSSVEKQMEEIRQSIQKSATEESLSSQRLAIMQEQREGISIEKDRELVESLLASAFSEKITLVIK